MTDLPDWPEDQPAEPADLSADDLASAGGMEAVVAAAAEGELGAAYPDFATWMVEWLAPTIYRPLRAGVMWCPKWWDHEEAVERLDSLWRAWEAARVEGGGGMSYWWTTHFDSHWMVLTSERGPFAACKEQTHDPRLAMLPCDSPPENWRP